jgi:hypothetical protein
MLQAVLKLERSIKERRDVDVPLMNWWLMLILNFLTVGIVGWVMWFKRTSRVDAFIDRKSRYYEYLLDYTEKYSKEKKKYDAIKNDLNDLSSSIEMSFTKDVKPIKAWLSLILSILTLGLWCFVWLYKLNKIWYLLEKIEQDFDDSLSTIWEKTGLLKYPLNFDLDVSKKRSFALYLFLSIVTCGVWLLVWDFKIHTDPDNIYNEFHSIEDTVLQTAKQNS